MIVFAPAVSYVTANEKINDTVTTDVTEMRADLRVGLQFSILFVGGLYKYETSPTPGSNLNATSLGPSAGFVSGPFSLIGTYFVQGQRKVSAGPSFYTKGTGYQIDLALTPSLTESIAVGPELSYRNITYHNTQVAGGAVTSDRDQIKDLLPQIVFVFSF